MKSEYLIFNVFVLSGPFFLGLLRPFYFVDKWIFAFFSITVVAIPFIIWDILVTGSHWTFNDDFILGLKIAKLPIEEWLFFITVPFACLYTWEMIIRRVDKNILFKQRQWRYLLFIFPLIGILVFQKGYEYTGLVLIFIGMASLLDQFSGTKLLEQKRFYLFILFISLFNLIFNGYLTWRPVVLYGEAYQLGLRITTIPVEDFGYGFALLFLNVIIYEKIKILRLKKA
jgi:lycopene cyclase domain-containing protein